MESKEFRRSLCIVAGTTTLCEAVVWAVIAIYGIGVYQCAWDFPNLENGVSTWSVFYITYFMGGCKSAIGAGILGYRLIPPTDSAKNLTIWMWIYAIVNAVWIPTCVLLIVAAMSNLKGKQGALFYYPWVAFTAILIVMDLAGAIYHLVDLFNTTTPDKFGAFCGAQNWATLTNSASTDGVTSWLPSLYMTLYFCRFLVLWVINIIFVYIVYRVSNAVSLYKSKGMQTTAAPLDKNKNKTEQEPNQTIFEQQPRNNTTNTRSNNTEDIRPRSPVIARQQSVARSGTGLERQESFPARYKTDEFGIPIEELNSSEATRGAAVSQNEDTFPRTPYQPTGRVFDFTGRPVRPESIGDRWQESAPPMASGVQVPPELNKLKPFSYTAGDQPQLMRAAPLSRSNSKNEYPSIPRPDYTVADRRSVSLEYVPNRFKVPSPKRPLQSQNSYDSSMSAPSSPKKVPPAIPRKPQVFPRSTPPIAEDPRTAPLGSYIPQQAVPSQQQAYYTRQTSQGNNYNINKLY